MSKATVEGLKEISRWVVCLVVGWGLSEILRQINVIPEYYNLKIWLFVFNIPVRLVVQTAVTLSGRFIDKWQHERGKETQPYPVNDVPSFGWLKF